MPTKNKIDRIIELLEGLDGEDKAELMYKLHGEAEPEEPKPKKRRSRKDKKNKNIASIERNPEKRIQQPQSKSRRGKGNLKCQGQKIRRKDDDGKSSGTTPARQESMQTGIERENKFLTQRNKLAPRGDERDLAKATKFDKAVALNATPVERTRESTTVEIECCKCRDWFEVSSAFIVNKKYTCNDCQRNR